MFNQLFPHVNSIFRMLKKEYHSSLAIMLQRIESCIVLEVICKMISKDFPDLPIFTIHDSIVIHLIRDSLFKHISMNWLRTFSLQVMPGCHTGYIVWNAGGCYTFPNQFLAFPNSTSALTYLIHFRFLIHYLYTTNVNLPYALLNQWLWP